MFSVLWGRRGTSDAPGTRLIAPPATSASPCGGCSRKPEGRDTHRRGLRRRDRPPPSRSPSSSASRLETSTPQREHAVRRRGQGRRRAAKIARRVARAGQARAVAPLHPPPCLFARSPSSASSPPPPPQSKPKPTRHTEPRACNAARYTFCRIGIEAAGQVKILFVASPRTSIQKIPGSSERLTRARPVSSVCLTARRTPGAGRHPGARSAPRAVGASAGCAS